MVTRSFQLGGPWAGFATMLWTRICAASGAFLGTNSTGFGARGPTTPTWPTTVNWVVANGSRTSAIGTYYYIVLLRAHYSFLCFGYPRVNTAKKKFKNKQTKQMNKKKTSRTNNKEKTQIKESIKQHKNAFWESKRSSCVIVKAFREQAVLKKSHLNHEQDLSWKNNTVFPLSEATFIFTRASLPIANPLIIL